MPRHAPPSRELWAEWTQIWPIVWRQQDVGPLALRPEAALVDPAAIAGIREHMQRAWRLAEQSRAAGGAFNAAIIVDPETGVVCMMRLKSTGRPVENAAHNAVRPHQN